MSNTAALLGVFALGLVSGYFLRGASRISMSADEIAWGWGFKRRHRRRSQRDVRTRGGGVRAPAVGSSPSAAVQLVPSAGSSDSRAPRWLFLAGLTTGAAFATGYLLLGADPNALNWIGLSWIETMPGFMRLAHWAG